MAVAIRDFGPQFRIFEAAGLAYEVGVILDHLLLGRDPGRLLTVSGIVTREDLLGEESPDWLDVDDEAFERYLKSLDPREFKKQDHYKVLGLSKLRWKASEEQIRIAYRRKVLKHHPDKRKQKNVSLGEEDYFVCITRAYEQLGMTLQRRRAYDSVDPLFDDSIPSSLVSGCSIEDFLSTFTSVFERNSRFSINSPVPDLGKDCSSREVVDAFYFFWFDFSTWREFSYLDEEDKEKGEDRYERREIEKANKLERERRRKKEMKRIRTLVENAYAIDPRIAHFKNEEKRRKEKERQEREILAKRKREEELRLQAEQDLENRKLSEKEAEAEKERRDVAKRAKENAKKVKAMRRKRIFQLAEDNGYWSDSVEGRLKVTEDLECACLRLDCDMLEQLELSLREMTEREKIIAFISEKSGKEAVMTRKRDANSGENKENGQVVWTSEELSLLTKAVALYPAGVQNRWTAILNYLNDHRKTGTPKREKDVIRQVKGLAAVEAKPDNFSMKQHALGVGALGDEWSADEQRRLEQALRSVPASDPERWQLIADLVGSKTRKQCIERFKRVASWVKERKTATAPPPS